MVGRALFTGSSSAIDMKMLMLLTDGFGGHGGIAKFNRDLLTAFAGYSGCERIVAIPRLAPHATGALPHKVEFPLSGVDCKFKFAFTALKHALGGRFDFVLCAHINLLPLAWLCARLLRKPLWLIVHGVEAWQPASGFLVNRLVKRVDTVIAVSRVTLERFKSWSAVRPAREFILPNCVDLSRFGPGSKRADLLQRYGLEGRKVIMTLGRLDARERYKGIDEVLDVLPQLATRFPNLSYLIAGDGTDRERLRAKADAAGLNRCVVFTGHVPEAEKADHYRLADAFVMPGRGEGFGIVYLEAMACGIPAVASTADASREAVRDGELGFVVDPDKPEQVRGAIAAALDRGAGKVPDGLDYFSFDAFESRCHRIIQEIVPSAVRRSAPALAVAAITDLARKDSRCP